MQDTPFDDECKLIDCYEQNQRLDKTEKDELDSSYACMVTIVYGMSMDTGGKALSGARTAYYEAFHTIYIC